MNGTKGDGRMEPSNGLDRRAGLGQIKPIRVGVGGGGVDLRRGGVVVDESLSTAVHVRSSSER